MKLSLIIPVYNVEKYLEECLDSVIMQIIVDMEIILIDDGSKDNSGKICDKYAEKYNFIKVVHKKNEGVSVARNTGIKMAQGNYIFFLDSDDMLAPNILKKIEEDVKSELDLYSYQIQNITESGETINNNCYKYTMAEGRYSINDFIKKYEKQYNGYLPWSTQNVYKKDILLNNDVIYPSGVVVAEDMYFFMNFIKYISTVGFYYDNIILYRTNRQGSAMTNISVNGIENIMEITSKIFFDKSNVVPKLFANAYTSNIWEIALIEDENIRNSLIEKVNLKIVFNSTGIRYFLLKVIFIILGKKRTVEWLRKRQLKKVIYER